MKQTGSLGGLGRCFTSHCVIEGLKCTLLLFIVRLDFSLIPFLLCQYFSSFVVMYMLLHYNHDKSLTL